MGCPTCLSEDACSFVWVCASLLPSDLFPLHPRFKPGVNDQNRWKVDYYKILLCATCKKQQEESDCKRTLSCLLPHIRLSWRFISQPITRMIYAHTCPENISNVEVTTGLVSRRLTNVSLTKCTYSDNTHPIFLRMLASLIFQYQYTVFYLPIV